MVTPFERERRGRSRRRAQARAQPGRAWVARGRRRRHDRREPDAHGRRADRAAAGRQGRARRRGDGDRGHRNERHASLASDLTEASTDAGADAVLVVTPYYNKPNQAGLKAHFAAVAAATDRPVVLYNIPSRCVINMSPGAASAEIAAENENVVAVKQANDDENGPIEGLDILAGNDDVFFRTLEIGGAGGILVASHVVGDEMREIYDAARAGRPRPRAGVARAAHAGVRGDGGHRQPDPGEDGARDARRRLGADAAADGGGRRGSAHRDPHGARIARTADRNNMITESSQPGRRARVRLDLICMR